MIWLVVKFRHKDYLVKFHKRMKYIPKQHRTSFVYKLNRDWVYHTGQDSRCRLCKDVVETIQHITAGREMQADRVYMERYNKVTSIVYRNMCWPTKSQGQSGINRQS